MPRYEEVEVLIPAHDLQKLTMAAQEDMPESCTCLGEGMLGEGKYKNVKRARLLMTPRQAASLHGGAKKIRMSAAQLRAMRGRGILMDTAKLGSAVIQNVADSFLPNSDLANGLADILLETGDTIERTFTGKKQYDYEQAAKNFNNAVDKAKAYVALDEPARRQKYEQFVRAMQSLPFVKGKLPVGTFEQYDAQQEEMAKKGKRTAKSAKEARFKQLRGDAKAAEAASQLVEVGKQKLIEKVPVIGDVLQVADLAKSVSKDPSKAVKAATTIAKKVIADPGAAAAAVSKVIEDPKQFSKAARDYFAAMGMTPEFAATQGLTYPGAGKRGRPKKLSGNLRDLQAIGGASMGDDIANYIELALKGDAAPEASPEYGSGITTYGGRMAPGKRSVKSLSLQKKR